MAELVDALVSKTSGLLPLPVRSRLRVPIFSVVIIENQAIQDDFRTIA
jgi:hypothetical protein